VTTFSVAAGSRRTATAFGHELDSMALSAATSHSWSPMGLQPALMARKPRRFIITTKTHQIRELIVIDALSTRYCRCPANMARWPSESCRESGAPNGANETILPKYGRFRACYPRIAVIVFLHSFSSSAERRSHADCLIADERTRHSVPPTLCGCIETKSLRQ
jgi:hypothetical protein